MTDRLYYTDARLDRFTAVVLDITDEGRRVVLDRTAFYPTSGGQPHDLGTLGGIAVVNVIDDDERIAHLLAEPIGVPLGSMLVGQIDMTRRFDHMQQHTGQHLLSAMLTDEFGWPTVSVHFGDDTNTVDVACDDFDATTLAAIERRANALIVQNRRVTVSFEDGAEATGLRKPSDRDGELRIVTIEGIDRSACGGTHVDFTGEIGALLLRRAEKTKGNTRIEFVCGHRAVSRARLDADLLTKAARTLSAAPHDLPGLVEQQLQRLADLERERKRLAAELARHEAAALWTACIPDSDGVRRIVVSASGPVKESEPLAQQLVALGFCAVVVTNAAAGGVLMATAQDTGIDAGQTLRTALQAVGGRGGGSPRLAQGAVPDPSQLHIVLEQLGFLPPSKELLA
ncbi:DHHA1 domain-containing protein [Gemmatimonas sp.]|uniref:alanyl-tRNA editing protein n=1 Tax=Gemmatimonas sp. TaxID=1962908 RepID=UPI00286DD586|nr:DHHA1 domain-containing protein [Gemmatimonas sp.]